MLNMLVKHIHKGPLQHVNLPVILSKRVCSLYGARAAAVAAPPMVHLILILLINRLLAVVDATQHLLLLSIFSYAFVIC
jgi:hypothetical protein